jgi:hypothetical protein
LGAGASGACRPLLGGEAPDRLARLRDGSGQECECWLATIITPLTATVLASVDARYAGIASGVTNSLSRLGQLLGVAALPLAAGRSGADFQSAAAMADGFPIAMTVAGGGCFAAALLAWTTISNDALDQPATGAKPLARERPASVDLSCAVAGTPLSPPLSRQPPATAAPTTPNG